MSDEEQKKLFEERIKRLGGRPSASSIPKPGPVHDTPKVRARIQSKGQSGSLMGALVWMVIGGVLGIGCALLLSGATKDFSPWGPGTAMNDAALTIGLGGLVLAVPLFILGMILRKKRSGLFNFSLAFLAAYLVAYLV